MRRTLGALVHEGLVALTIPGKPDSSASKEDHGRISTTMTRGDYQLLLSEKTALQRMLEATSADQVITRGSLQSRLDSVESDLARLQTTNLVEQEKIIEGLLRGILPGAREFEFQPSAGGKPIHGKVATGLQGIDRLNQLLDQPIRIKVLETRVGKGSVRYRLLEAPTGQQA